MLNWLTTLSAVIAVLNQSCSGSKFSGGVTSSKSEQNRAETNQEDDPNRNETSKDGPVDINEIQTGDGLLQTICDKAQAGGPLGFENFLDGTSVTRGTTVTNQFETLYGITFSLSSGGEPVIADVGGIYDAFSTDGQGNDGIAPEDVSKVGKFFLTDDGVKGTAHGLIVKYRVPAVEASGHLLDVDGSEVWTIEAFDENGTASASPVTVTRGKSGDARATYWEIRASTGSKISKIVLTPSGGVNFGLGFDNFSPGKICP